MMSKAIIIIISIGIVALSLFDLRWLYPMLGSPIPKHHYYDVPLHAIAYFILFCLVKKTFFTAGSLKIALYILTFSTLLEVLQEFSGRTFSFLDLFANFCGIIIAFIIYYRQEQKNSNNENTDL